MLVFILTAILLLLLLLLFVFLEENLSVLIDNHFNYYFLSSNIFSYLFQVKKKN